MSGFEMVKTYELTILHNTVSPYLTTSINRKAKISDMDIRITWWQQLPYPHYHIIKRRYHNFV